MKEGGGGRAERDLQLARNVIDSHGDLIFGLFFLE